MNQKNAVGHLSALFTIFLWGTTFISTKILLVGLTPTEILFIRFLLGLAVLTVACPKRLRIKDRKQELVFAAAGLCGVCLYYLLENIALTFTMASNVGVITSVAPFFTAVLAHIFFKNEEKLRLNFFIGFFVAMAGICLISWSESRLAINPLGDILAVGAAFSWAIYSLLTRKISTYGYSTIQTTRRIFMYGILFMIPSLFFYDFSFDIHKYLKPEYIFNLVYLGIGASAICFVTWNYAVKILGAVRTSVYIYIIPVITIVTSTLILHEKITVFSAVGAMLTLTGLIISENRIEFRRRK